MNRKRAIRIGITAVLLVSVGANVFLYVQYRGAVDANPEVQTQRLIGQVSKTTTLPDETPSVVTVVDHTKLGNADLANGTEDGDKILTYAKAGKVYVFRPATGRLVNIYTLQTSPNTTKQ